MKHSAMAAALLLAASFMCAAGVVTATAASADLEAGVQAAMLMGAMLPQQGPGPSREAEAKMSRAGSLLYKGYQLLQAGSSSVEEAKQHLQSRRHVEAVAQNLASGEEMLQRGTASVTEGQRLEKEAEASLQAEASKNPLGPPPEAPIDWRRMPGMAARAVAKERSLRGELDESRRDAKSSGVSLIDVASEKVVRLEDPTAAKEESSLLAFLSQY